MEINKMAEVKKYVKKPVQIEAIHMKKSRL